MALSKPEALRRTHLTADLRRLNGRIAQYQRLSNEYKVMQAGAEMEAAAIKVELMRLNAHHREDVE